MQTRVTVISDTHDRHDEIDLPAGDLLIHCGDMFNISYRDAEQIEAMDAWFGRQKFARILCTGGNHDTALQAFAAHRREPFRNAHFVVDKVVTFRGLKIYGAPWVPALRTHAFYRDDAGLAAAWASVPSGLDILFTHTPPSGILDTSSRGRSLGCEALAAELPRIAPRVHCFGHVHASAGRRQVGETMFINAASYDGRTGTLREPVSFTFPTSVEASEPSTWRARLAQRWRGRRD